MVLAILSVSVALVAPGLSPERFTSGMKTGIRRFTGVLAEARNQAMVSGKRRIVLVDYSGQGVGERVCFRLVDEDEPRERESLAASEDRGGRCLPSGVRIARVRTWNGTSGEEEGTARFAVLPSGLVQPGLIYVQDGEKKRTLRIWPFLAHPEILRGHPRIGEEGLGDLGSGAVDTENGALGQ